MHPPLYSQFCADDYIEEYIEPQDKYFTIDSWPLTVLVANYCAAITDYEDTINAMERYVDKFIVNERLTLDCMYLCCFMNNLECLKGFYGVDSSEVIDEELDRLKKWHKHIFGLMSILLEEEFYSISIFLKDIESDSSDFNRLVSDMELLDPESKQKLAFLYVHNQKNYALGIFSHIAIEVFHSFHKQRNTFMEQNATQWAFLGKVNRSKEFWFYTRPMGLEFSFLSLEDIDPTLASHIEEMDKTKNFNLFRREFYFKSNLLNLS